MNEAQIAALKALVNSADDLCTAVISGKPDGMKLALQVARALDDVRRSGVRAQLMTK